MEIWQTQLEVNKTLTLFKAYLNFFFHFELLIWVRQVHVIASIIVDTHSSAPCAKVFAILHSQLYIPGEHSLVNDFSFIHCSQAMQLGHQPPTPQL